MTTKTKTKLIPLLVTTAHKGVFFGYGQKTDKKIITLKQARMVVYWSADVRGVHGLAVNGPSKDCKVGFAVPTLLIQDITSLAECTKEAAEAFERQPWGR